MRTPGEAKQVVKRLLESAVLTASEPDACPYLPDRIARSTGFRVQGHMDPAIYQTLMDHRFRRSGNIFYRPDCPRCTRCVPYRVRVDAFRPTRSMRRVRRRNADLRVEIGDGISSDRKHALFTRYLAHQHDGSMDPDRAGFDRFLYDAPIPTIEFCYYLGRRLIGVSIADRCPAALSSVYMFFDPDFSARSPGTYSILWEIDYCRRLGIPYYYLGYYVRGCASMAYKARFRPGAFLVSPEHWSPRNPDDPD